MQKIVRIWIWLTSALLVLACLDLSTPAASEPPTVTPLTIPLQATLTPFLASTIEPSVTQPPALTFTPLPTFTFTPSETSTFTPTILPSSTNTPLPTLPSFNQVLNFGGGGGAGHTCMAPAFKPPVVYAAWSGYAAHVAGICGFDSPLPVNTPIHVEISYPDQQITLQRDLMLKPGNGSEGTAGWIAPLGDHYGNWASACNTQGCLSWGIEFWWPSGVSNGVWQILLTWNGGKYSTTFDAATSLPELSEWDNLSQSLLSPAGSLDSCHPVPSGTTLSVVGRGFPANTLVYVPVFEETGTTEFHFLYTQAFTTDNAGALMGALTGPFQSEKKYIVAGVTDPSASLTAGNAIDCFIIP